MDEINVSKETKELVEECVDMAANADSTIEKIGFGTIVIGIAACVGLCTIGYGAVKGIAKVTEKISNRKNAYADDLPDDDDYFDFDDLEDIVSDELSDNN